MDEFGEGEVELDTRNPEDQGNIGDSSEEKIDSEDQSIYMEEASQLAKSGESQYRTKTMADILAEQGDYSQAVDIYEELYENTEDEEEKKKLKQVIDEIKGEQKELAGTDDQDENKTRKKQKFVSRMSKLAERLEAKES